MDALIPRAPRMDPKSCEDTGWVGQPLDTGATAWAQPRGTATSTPARPSVPEPTVRIRFFKIKKTHPDKDKCHSRPAGLFHAPLQEAGQARGAGSCRLQAAGLPGATHVL